MSRRFSTILSNRKFWYELYTDAITNRSNTYSRELSDSSRKEMIPYILASFSATTALVLFSHTETNAKIDNIHAKLTETNARMDKSNTETNAKFDDINAKLTETNIKLDNLVGLLHESKRGRFF